MDPVSEQDQTIAIEAYLSAKADLEAAQREMDAFRLAAEAHLSLFNQNAANRTVIYDLKIGDTTAQSTTVRSQQSALRGVGGLLWPCGRVLATLICSGLYLSPKSGSVCCELGCGAGALPSIAAAACFPEDCSIFATDTDDIVPLTRINLSNYFDSSSSFRTITVVAYNWGEDCSAGIPSVDVLLAADVIYAERSHERLIHTISQLLKINGGVLLLSYTERIIPEEEQFLQRLSRIGFALEVVDRRVEGGQTVVTVRGVRSPVKVLKEIGLQHVDKYLHETFIVNISKDDNDGLYL